MLKKLLCGLSVLALTLGIGTSAFASTSGTTTTSVNIMPGQLDLTTPAISRNFSPITLNGDIQSSTATLSDFNVKDATGSGDGWHVTVGATQLSDGKGHTLPKGTLSLKAPNKVEDMVSSTSALPSIKTGTYNIDSSSYTLLSADVKQGMGTYNVTFPTDALTLTINPGNVFVTPETGSSYSTTITWTIVSGP